MIKLSFCQNDPPMGDGTLKGDANVFCIAYVAAIFQKISSEFRIINALCKVG